MVPLKLVKAVLPDPSSLAAGYTGKTVIGNFIKGKRGDTVETLFIYNVADHAGAFAEVGSQAISYTAGEPAAAAAILVARGDWDARRMVNVEELPPRPFLGLLSRMGLPTRLKDARRDTELTFGASSRPVGAGEPVPLG